MEKQSLTEYCVYAIRHTEVLDDIFLDEGGQSTFEENKRWVEGKRLFDEADRAGKRMPVIFGRAETDSELLFYAFLESVDIDEHAQTTRYSFSGMTEIQPPLPLHTLLKKNDGQPLSDDYIKSYVLCLTPDYIV